MAMYSVLTFFIINFLMICAQESTVVDLSEFENSTDKQNFRNNTDSDIADARRYGFQQTMTRACKDFAKTFICIRKCLDFKFDIARSDRNCKCTCYKHAEKATYTMPLAGFTNGSKWKSGPPTTTMFVTPKFPPTFDDPPEEESDDNEDTTDKKSDEKSGESGSNKDDSQESDSNATKNESGGKPVTDEDGNFVTGEDGQTIIEGGGGEKDGEEGGDEKKADEEGEGTKAEGEEEEGTKAEEEAGAETEADGK